MQITRILVIWGLIDVLGGLMGNSVVPREHDAILWHKVSFAKDTLWRVRRARWTNGDRSGRHKKTPEVTSFGGYFW